MYKALKYSLALHALLVTVFLFKLPDFYKETHPETVVTVDIVRVSEMTNLKNTSKSKAHSKKKVRLPKPAPKKTIKRKDPKIKAPSHTPKVKKAINKQLPKKEDDLDSLLKDLESNGGASTNDSKTLKTNNSSTKPYNENIPLTLSEKDNIKIQIEKKFVNPVVLDFKPKELVIKIKLNMNKDGSIENAASLNSSIYPKKYSNIFNTLKNALIRASHVASPIVGMPLNKYGGSNGWQEIELTFDAYYLMHLN
jgi:hypothetical protein